VCVEGEQAVDGGVPVGGFVVFGGELGGVLQQQVVDGQASVHCDLHQVQSDQRVGQGVDVAGGQTGQRSRRGGAQTGGCGHRAEEPEEPSGRWCEQLVRQVERTAYRGVLVAVEPQLGHPPARGELLHLLPRR
jgi:hypothetical protein